MVTSRQGAQLTSRCRARIYLDIACIFFDHFFHPRTEAPFPGNQQDDGKPSCFPSTELLQPSHQVWAIGSLVPYALFFVCLQRLKQGYLEFGYQWGVGDRQRRRSSNEILSKLPTKYTGICTTSQYPPGHWTPIKCIIYHVRHPVRFILFFFFPLFFFSSSFIYSFNYLII